MNVCNHKVLSLSLSIVLAALAFVKIAQCKEFLTRFSPNTKKTSSDSLHSQSINRGIVHFAPFGRIAVPLQIGVGRNWNELIIQSNPVYFDAVKIRSGPLLGPLAASQLDKLGELRAGHPSLPRWIVLIRGGNEWFIPETYFVEYMGQSISAKESDVLYSIDVQDLGIKNRLTSIKDGPNSFELQLPFNSVRSVKSIYLQSKDTAYIFRIGLASDPLDRSLKTFQQALDDKQLEILVITCNKPVGTRVQNFVVPVPNTTVYGYSNNDYWNVFKVKILPGDSVTFTRRDYLPIVEYNRTSETVRGQAKYAHTTEPCLIKQRQLRAPFSR